jgi:hypothetical protein
MRVITSRMRSSMCSSRSGLFAATRYSVSEGRPTCSIVVSRHVRVARFDAQLAATLSSPHTIRSENCLSFRLRSSPLRMNLRHVTQKRFGWVGSKTVRYPILPHFSFVRGKHLLRTLRTALLDAPFRVPDSLPQLVVGLECYREAIATGQVGSNRIEVI